jgi:hypothetical protein
MSLANTEARAIANKIDPQTLFTLSSADNAF